MANSYNTYVANGSQTAYLVTFEQRVFTQIQVYLNSELQTSGYTYNSVTKQIVFDTAPPIGVIVRLQRYTSEVLLNKFGQDAAFTGSNLDENFEQILFKAEETQEAWLAPLDRAVRVPNSEVSINALPNVANRRNKALGFDSNGQPFMIPLVNIPDSALAIALAMTDGGKWIGTLGGGTFLDRQDTVCLSEFTNNTGYASISAAVQACFDYAAANSKVVDARGWVGTLNANVTMTNIEVVGGTWKGTSDVFIVNSLFRNFEINNLRLRPYGGDVRIRYGLFDGKPTLSKVASVMLQAIPATGTIEVTDCEFRNGLYGILQQGTGSVMTRGLFRNLSFYDMGGDGIELNVVQNHYDDGCLIENIYLENIDSTGQAPISPSNWGIGIGVAGSSPYGLDTPDSYYAKNITIRNVKARRCRQIVHFEQVRDSLIENIDGDPDQNTSNGSGLTMATVLCYGARRVTINGVRGEPVVTEGTDPHSIRIVMLEWGTNAGVGARGPCQHMTVRNVSTRNGRFYAGVGCQAVGLDNTATFENIDCYNFRVFGVARELNLANITCTVFDCIGDDSAGGTASNGYLAVGRTTLNMTNVNALSEDLVANQGWSRCAYSYVSSVASNVYARPYPRQGIDGGIGVPVWPSNRVYVMPDAAAVNITDWDGTKFPAGREFVEGDLIVRTDGKFFTVTRSGAYIPAIAEYQVKAAAVGQTYLASNYPMDGNKGTMVWIYKYMLTPGTHINIPGAGAGGGVLQTTIARGPYRTDVNNPTSEIRVGITDPIQTAIPAGTQLSATYPIAFRSPS